MIKAPFNFIPLPSKAVYPAWGKMISHDIPFSDGLSGTISVTLTARSPIFVRNGHSRSEKELQSGNYTSFSKTGKDNFFIPATSVKGMVRSVVEILSFGKLRTDPDVKFALRDWANNRDIYPIIHPTEQQKLRCGWIVPVEDGEDDEYELIDCGKPLRIAQTRIDEYLKGSYFSDNFSQRSGDLNKERAAGGIMCDPKTAEFKYRMIPSVEKLYNVPLATDEEYNSSSITNRVMVDPDGDYEYTGTIVFTGQPDKWKNRDVPHSKDAGGKFYEFVFPDKELRVFKISKEEFAHYKSIYKDSPDWEYAMKNMLDTTGIPVFFRPDNNDKKKVKDWGLAFLYKLPYERTPMEAYEAHHPMDATFRPDMAECIFGYTEVEKRNRRDDGSQSLKGRVQFSPFKADKAEEDRELSLVLGSPKPSYFPIYINQGETDSQGNLYRSYKTYNDGDLKGWKRYVLRKSTWQKNTGSKDLDTSLKPLKAGAVFEGKVHFHNLRPEELGAVLSALTFHGNEQRAFHQLGMGKPYGYGKVTVKVTGLDVESVGAADLQTYQTVDPYMAIFEAYMDKQLGTQFWRATPTIKELFTLSTKEVADNDSFNYMILETDGKNEFIEAKGDKSHKYALPYFSKIIADSTTPPSLKTEQEDAVKHHIDFPTELKNKLEKEEEDRLAAIQARKDELERIRIADEETARIMAKQASGLAGVLEEKFEVGPNTGAYKVTTFKIGKEKIEKWMKAVGYDSLPESEMPSLAAFVKRMAAAEESGDSKAKGKRKRDKGKGQPAPFKDRASANWQFIEKIASKDFADRLFSELNP